MASKKSKKGKPNPNRRQVIITATSGKLRVTIKVSPWQAEMVEAKDWEGARSVFIQALMKFKKEYPNYNWEFLNEENCILEVVKKITPPAPKLKKNEPIQIPLFKI